MRPHALLSNDDGIDSVFFHRLVDALLPEFRISIAAPAFEQSWIGRAISRHKEIEVIRSPARFPGVSDAWAISGTPSDCVNIALGNLLSKPPDLVVSGINIGFNTCDTLILSSGTVAAAIEGALWGLPALAFSKCIPSSSFEQIRSSRGNALGDDARSLAAAADHARLLARALLDDPPHTGCVVNVNFPSKTMPETPVEETFPAKLRLGSLYTETSPGHFAFRYGEGSVLEADPGSDRATLDRGSISRSVLDFGRIGRPPAVSRVSGE